MKKIILLMFLTSPFVFSQTLEKISSGHGIVWGMAFIDNNNLLFTEREGNFKILNIKTKEVQKVKSVPVRKGGQAGLLDVVLDTDFAKNKKIYFTYSKVVKDKHTTALAVASLVKKNNQWDLSNIQDLFVAEPAFTENIHYGSRLVITDKEIWMTVGERNNRNLAQDLSTHMGKVLRMGKDGKALPDNPFINDKKAKPEIWSYGHRNAQGMLKHPLTGEIWLHEHGPRGGDEINIVEKGANYGWPDVSYGREYWGPKISDSPRKRGVKDPIYQYTPSIAPSGFVYYTGSKIPAFKDSFLIGALVLTHLNQVTIKGDAKPVEKRHFEGQGMRIREVEIGSDELIYFGTDAGEILRIN